MSTSKVYIPFALFIALCGVFLSLTVRAQTADDIESLRKQISERGSRLEEIEREIKEFQAELKKVGGEKNSLQKAISQLELERKKVQADLSYTQGKISATDLEIKSLSLQIKDAEGEIQKMKEGLAASVRSIAYSDDTTPIEIFLAHEKMSDFWYTLDGLDQIQRHLREEMLALTEEKRKLQGHVNDSTEKREELVDLKEQYSDQNTVLTENKTEKDKLLTVTKNEEAEYQKLLQEREVARAQILKELRDFESKLQFILDPNTIPAKGTAIFSWPVDNVIITQLFGGTEFAKQNSSVYGGRAYHPGVDFGVPRGSKIYAPLSGTVRATGDTDLVTGCYSWGKWTLIDHPNGLSTLYAHQSVISVTPGQSVSTGDVIGYSGNTGYSTGPHLHFTVYAKAGVSVRKFNEIKAVTSCGAATTPIAATDAYIDPMDYLPPAP